MSIGIESSWDEDFENGLVDLEVTGAEVAAAFNPENIVESAEAWDSEIVTWICERILIPKDILAVTTNDGAIVFDRDLIREA